MAIIFSLSPKTNEQGQSEILIRYKSGEFAARAKSGVFVLSQWYSFVIGGKIESPYKGKKLITDEMKEIKTYHERQRTELSTIHYLIDEILKNPLLDRTKSDWLNDCIDKFYNRGRYAPVEVTPESKQTFFDTLDEYLEKRKLSDVREKNFMVLKRALQRYELIVTKREKRVFRLELDTVTSETIKDFECFLRDEHTLYEKYKTVYDKFPAIINSKRKASKPQPRGMNTINALFNKLRAFYNWCNDKGKTDNRPFRNYEGTPDLYTETPYYITIDERNTIYNADLSDRPQLAVQRDIFVFQCHIGCRVGDLIKMTKHNIINGAIEYIPRKTKDGHPVTVRVPLNETAKEILKRYKSDDNRLLPFISEQKYNVAIKDVFRLAGITRIVTVINSTTRNEEKRPINEIASSHLARRTFCGNLYKKVKDPNLVGALSGHTDGSKAFARYRDIDDEMKTELVRMLE